MEFGQGSLKGHANFGLPNGTNANSTTRFLKSHEKAPVLPERELRQHVVCLAKCPARSNCILLFMCAASAPSNTKTKLKPSVPFRDEAPTMGLSSNKNYVTSNAVEAILSKPGKVAQEGFQWTTRPGYGEVPMYLKQNQLTIRREKESFEEYVKMRSQPVRPCVMCSMIWPCKLGMRW